MNGYEYIIAKQTAWAQNRNIRLIGSKITRGRPTYTPELEQNLFSSLLPEVKRSLAEGDGGELGKDGFPGKMQAVHSSSALGINVFQYWKSISAVPVIAAACNFCRADSGVSFDIKFEEKYPIDDSFSRHPNIDVVIHNKSDTKIQRFAIECKFSEAYGGREHPGLKQKYLDLEGVWDDIPALHQLSKRICPDDESFRHLHPAQLIKHILGLKRRFGRGGFRLLYLWYDVLADDGKRHRDEITEFTEVAKRDGILFHAMSYQELIIGLGKQHRGEHPEYVRYLSERYL